MLRTSARDEYLLRINLKKGAVARRFCEVHVKGNDVYVMQPRKGKSVKVTYHQSGQRHLKHGNGPAMFVLQLDRPEWIQKEEPCWESSFENFAHLLAYQRERADSVYDIELPPRSTSTITFAQVSIGRFFDHQAWKNEGVTLATLLQQVFPVPISPSNLSICVRVLRLAYADPWVVRVGGRFMAWITRAFRRCCHPSPLSS